MKIVKMMMSSGLLTIAFLNHAQQQFFYYESDSFEESVDQPTDYKRIYYVRGTAIFVDDFVEDTIVLRSKFTNAKKRRICDDFIQSYRHGVLNPNTDENEYYASLFEDLVVELTEFKEGRISKNLIYKNEQLKYTEVYDNDFLQVLSDSGDGKLITEDAGRTYNTIYKDGVQVKHYQIRRIEQDTIHFQLDKAATPKYGFKGISKKIGKVFKVDAAKYGMVIKLYIMFIVDEKGNLSEFECVNCNSPLFEHVKIKKELSALEELGPWIPSELNGKPVKTRIVLPIVFQ